jgi:hypothetical protein
VPNVDRAQTAQIRERHRGLRRIRHLTAWTAAGASALAVVFGGIFAQATSSTAGDATAPISGTSSNAVPAAPGPSPLSTPTGKASGLKPPTTAPTTPPRTTKSHVRSGAS